MPEIKRENLEAEGLGLFDAEDAIRKLIRQTILLEPLPLILSEDGTE